MTCRKFKRKVTKCFKKIREEEKERKNIRMLKSFYRNQVLFKWNLKPYYLQASVIKKVLYQFYIKRFLTKNIYNNYSKYLQVLKYLHSEYKTKFNHSSMFKFLFKFLFLKLFQD